MDKEIFIFIFEFIASAMIVYGISLVFIPAAIITAGVLLFIFIKSIESYLDEKERRAKSRSGILDHEGWV